ncbi:MAG: integrin alpha [Myxococcales bacterium]
MPGLFTVAPAGDVDDDGYADFLIGNPNYNVLDSSGNVLAPKVGEVYLIHGGPRVKP